MNNFYRKALYSALFSATISSAAHAGNFSKPQPVQPFNSSSPNIPSYYVGGSLGASSASSYCDGKTNCEDSDTGWKIYGGYQLTDLLTIEAGYADLGNLAEDTGSVTSNDNIKGFTGNLLAAYPVYKDLKVFGKVGAFKRKTEDDQEDFLDEIEPVFGLGADYEFADNISLRGEWENYKNAATSTTNNASDIQMLSVGMTFSSL